MPEWIVRVGGKEYGPVGRDALREWKAEGRLLPENEVRRARDGQWMRAGDVLEIFNETEVSEPALKLPESTNERTWPQILSESFRIYRRGLGRFLIFGLLSAVPMFALQWTLPTLHLPDLSAAGAGTVAWPAFQPISLLLMLVVLAMWPISTAGFQFVADDIFHGKSRSLGDQFRAAVGRCGQVLTAALLVYGSYLFWFVVPFTILLTLAGSGQISLFSTFLFLAISTFMVYMNARLFINFLFWHQTSALRPNGALMALRESRELARSVPEQRRLDRPMYRGAILASVWLLLILILTFGVQLPFLVARFIGAANPEEAMALARAAAEAKMPDMLTLLADVASSAVNLLLQPLLAAAFIVLYYDARSRSGKDVADGDEITSD